MYYKFLDSIDSKEIGQHPQLKDTWPGGIDYWAPNSFANAPLEGLIEYDIVFPNFDLAKHAKLTDRLSTGSLTDDFVVVSDKLLVLLRAYKIDQFQEFPIQVGIPSGTVNYTILYFPFSRDSDFIDWEESIFIRQLPAGEAIEEKFGSARAFNLAKDSHEIQFDNVVINESVLEDFDIFKFKWIKAGTYVSDRLRQAMLDERITGIRFEAAEWLENVQKV